MENKKNFTWADLKKVVNEIPEDLLKNQVTVWADGGERGYVVSNVEILEEDFVFDGDEGCAQKSIMINTIENDEKETFEQDYYLIHPKGTRILYAD